jgi:hypothetical protein
MIDMQASRLTSRPYVFGTIAMVVRIWVSAHTKDRV